MDKGYYDYDYTEPKVIQKTELKAKSDKEMSSMLERFGFKTKLRSKESKQPLSAEEIQNIAMNEQNNKQ